MSEEVVPFFPQVKYEESKLQVAQHEEPKLVVYYELRDTITQLRSENERLREALRFYANKDNWEYHAKGLSLNWINQIKYDTSRFELRDEIGGKRAREALELSGNAGELK